MIRIALTIFMCLGSAPWVLADEEALAAPLPATIHTIFGGVIKTVTWADASKGTKSEIVVLDPAKKPVHILVTSNTTLWDKEAKAIMPDKIAPRARVNVIYLTSPEGVNLAKSLKLD